MYTPDQRTASEIIDDKTIILPRFQRKKSWSDIDRFKLCVSLFKEYPMGTIVLKKERRGKKDVKWLLDGRQRRDTLVDMQNPENVYKWGKAFLGFKNNDDDIKIEKAFDDALGEYLYYDENPETDEVDDETVIEEGEDVIDATDYDEDEDSEEDEIEEDSDDIESEEELGQELESTDKRDLADLLYIIQSVHKLNRTSSNYTKPFDFRVDDFKPNYIVKNESGKSVVDSKKLTDWILSKNFDDVDSLTAEDVIDSFDNCPSRVQKAIKNRMDSIRRSINCVMKIHDRITETRVSIIFLDDNCSPADSQKIFEIINTQGVSLTNAEVLSAKPIWNAVISEPREILRTNVADLYKGLGTKQQSDVVKWDVAATLTCRLSPKADYIFGDLRTIPFKSDKKEEAIKVDNKINYGFKLYAGRYSKSISKNVVDNLANNNNIDWNSSSFEDEIKNVCTVLMSNDPAISRLSSYHYPLRKLFGDTVVMCYLFLLIDKYNSLTSNGSTDLKGNNRKTFIVDARTLLDRLVYEYCCGYWKGSSDSRLKSYLKSQDEAFKPINEQVWDSFIQEAFDNNTINGNTIKKNVLAVLVYYFSVVRNKSLELAEGESPQIDHIIPDGTFTKGSSGIEFKDSLINYALLTPLLNNKKKADVSSIEDAYLDEISRLEDIDVSTIRQLGDPGSMEILKEARFPIIEKIKTNRKQFVKGEGYWSIKV